VPADLIRRTTSQLAPTVEDCHFGGDFQDERNVVLDEEYSDAVIDNRVDSLGQMVELDGAESSRGLIEQEELGFEGDGASQLNETASAVG
jgi:hypothetical protein